MNVNTNITEFLKRNFKWDGKVNIYKFLIDHRICILDHCVVLFRTKTVMTTHMWSRNRQLGDYFVALGVSKIYWFLLSQKILNDDYWQYIAKYNTLVDLRKSSMKIDLLSALLLLPMFIFWFVYFQSTFQKRKS